MATKKKAKKKRYWEVKRVVVEYYYVEAESREQAIRRKYLKRR